MSNKNCYTVICSCQNSYQDKEYGKQVRVANLTKRNAGDGKSVVRCTVCGKEQVVKS